MIKFINPLPISEEMLGAYLEGNLSVEDSAKVESLLDNDASFREFVDDITISMPDSAQSIYDEHPGFDIDFRLPELPDVNDPLEIPDNVIDFTTILNNSLNEVAAYTFAEVAVADYQDYSDFNDNAAQLSEDQTEYDIDEGPDSINDNMEL